MKIRMIAFLSSLAILSYLLLIKITAIEYLFIPDGRNIAGLIIFLCLSVIVELNPRPYLSGQGQYSMGAEIDRATIVLFGPFWATLVTLVTYLFAHSYRRKNDIEKLIFNVFQFTLTVGLSGLTFVLAGGTINEIKFPSILLPLILSISVYSFVNKTLLCLYWSIERNESFLSLWSKNVQWQIIYDYASIPFSLFTIYMYLLPTRWAPWGLLVVFGPLYLMNKSYTIYSNLKENYKETITALVDIIEASDPYTSGHSKRVAKYSKKLAEGLKLRYNEIDDIEMAAILHDIGKIGREFQEILNKPSSLNPEELKLMHSHPTISFNLISRITFLKKINKMVLHHHELYDGSGKPDGISGEEIPLGARIIAIADAFDAMTSDRPYRKALPRSYAINELKKFSGIQFDPYLVEVWLKKCMPQEEEIHALKLEEVEAKVPG